VLFALL